MVPYEPSPTPGISIHFENIEYTWAGDHEMVPIVYYDHGQIGAVERLGPLDLEIRQNGLEVYMDGVTERAEKLFHSLGGSAWSAIAHEMKGFVPEAILFHTQGRTYTFFERGQDEHKQAA